MLSKISCRYIIWWKLITSNEEFTSANMDSWNPIFHPCRHKGLAPCPEVNKCRWSISLKKTDRQGEMINLTHGLNTKSWTHRLKHSNKNMFSRCSFPILSDLGMKQWNQTPDTLEAVEAAFVCPAKWPHPKCQIAPSKKKNNCKLC